MIPKNLHTIWIGDNQPKYDFRNRWNFFNGWNITHWNENSIRQEFPEISFDNLGPTKMSDYARILILQKYGGVYSDLDNIFLKSIDDLLNRESFLTYQFPCISAPKQFTPRGLSLKDEIKNNTNIFKFYNRDIYLNNSIIGSIPYSKMINKFVNVFEGDLKAPTNQKFSYIDYGSGPTMTTHVGNFFVELNGCTQHTDEVSIFDYTYFHPTNYIEYKLATVNRNFNDVIDEQIQKGKQLNSYCVHAQVSSEVEGYIN